MSEADKMFEELGYEKWIDSRNIIHFIHKKKEKDFTFMNGNCYSIKRPTQKEQVAINKKVEELRMDIEELKEALRLWIKKWKQEREVTIDEKEKIKLTSEIFLAQWIIKRKKGYGVDITRILREDKNRGVIKMSNKTSDKNVANIEELIQEYKTYNDLDGIQDLSIYINALENILAEREQKDKRIKELEEQVETKQKFIIMASEVIENSIPEQAVIDKINEYDKKMEEDAGHLHWVVTDRIVMNVLQELLGG